ncbi:adenylate kinase [Trueperella sp. LYQ143]|uniref:adenylate kinase n=1 Tax=unclassified Trueperella TaxID=2630174 RepID=UPI003983CBFC
MRKVLVIGCPGAGKSTFARRLHGIVGLPLHHLDLLFWNEDKTFVPASIFKGRQEKILNTDNWIIDGNYESTLERRLLFADTIFFLDYPLDVCIAGVKERSGKFRPDLPWKENENDETFEELVSFIRDFHKSGRQKISALLGTCSGKEVYHFKSRDEATMYLNALCQK